METSARLSFWPYFRACLHGVGGPQEGEITRLGGVTPCPYNLSFWFDHVNMIGGVTATCYLTFCYCDQISFLSIFENVEGSA